MNIKQQKKENDLIWEAIEGQVKRKAVYLNTLHVAYWTYPVDVDEDGVKTGIFRLVPEGHRAGMSTDLFENPEKEWSTEIVATYEQFKRYADSFYHPETGSYPLVGIGNDNRGFRENPETPAVAPTVPSTGPWQDAERTNANG
jgi:hypothetical protein